MREGGSRHGTKWLQSCLMTRYLFELTANHSVLRHGDDSDLKSSRWLDFLRTWKLHIFGHTYGIEVDKLTKPSKKRLRKFGAKTYKETSLWSRDNNQKVDHVKFEEEHFQFDDPFEMTMYKKLAFIGASKPRVFLSQWKMYSHISHASPFSLWPLWIEPVPHFDAIQCLSIILSTESKHQGLEFDGKLFSSSLFEAVKNS